MDEFTRNHLWAWMEQHIYTRDEQDRFEDYVVESLRDDPTYLDNIPWSSVYKSFQVGERRLSRAIN
jgi:hypothetical protein